MVGSRGKQRIWFQPYVQALPNLFRRVQHGDPVQGAKATVGMDYGTSVERAKAIRCFSGSAACVAALPLSMVVANRSAMAILGLAMFLLLLGLWYEGAVRQDMRRIRAFFDLIDSDRRSKILLYRIFACADLRFFRSTGVHLNGKCSRSVLFPCFFSCRGFFFFRNDALVLTGLFFLFWVFFSLFWSPFFLLSLMAFGEFLLALVLGLLLAVFLPQRAPGWMIPSVGFSCFIAAGLMLGDFLFDMTLRQNMAVGFKALTGQILTIRPYTFTHNRGMLTLLMLGIPVLIWLGRRYGKGAMLAALVVLGVSIGLSESGASKFGFALALTGFVLAALWPRLALAITTAITALCLLGAPFAGRAVQALVSPALHQHFAQSHTVERTQIWLAFGEAVSHLPWQGAGFGASARLKDHPALVNRPLSAISWIDAGHPHNVPLQIVTELGIPGMLLALGVLMAVLMRLGQVPQEQYAPMLALFLAAFAVMMVGHGAWQGWWIAVLGAAITVMRVQFCQKKDEAHGSG
jgi:O-antigen ligase